MEVLIFVLDIFACIDEIIHGLNLFHDGYDQQNNLIKL